MESGASTIAAVVLGLVCLVSAFVHPWASDRLLIRLQYRHPETWRQLSGSILPAEVRAEPIPWLGLRLIRYLLSGRHRQTDDPVLRRYGAATLYSVLGWSGSVAVFASLILIAWLA